MLVTPSPSNAHLFQHLMPLNVKFTTPNDPLQSRFSFLLLSKRFLFGIIFLNCLGHLHLSQLELKCCQLIL